MSKIILLVAVLGIAFGAILLWQSGQEPICTDIDGCAYAELTYKAQMQTNKGLQGLGIVVGSLLIYMTFKIEGLADDANSSKQSAEKLNEMLTKRRQQ